MGSHRNNLNSASELHYSVKAFRIKRVVGKTLSNLSRCFREPTTGNYFHQHVNVNVFNVTNLLKFILVADNSNIFYTRSCSPNLVDILCMDLNILSWMNRHKNNESLKCRNRINLVTYKLWNTAWAITIFDVFFSVDCSAIWGRMKHPQDKLNMRSTALQINKC